MPQTVISFGTLKKNVSKSDLLFWSGAEPDPDAPRKSILKDIFFYFDRYTTENDVEGYEAIASIIDSLSNHGLWMPTHEKIFAKEYSKNREDYKHTTLFWNKWQGLQLSVYHSNWDNWVSFFFPTFINFNVHFI